MKTELKLGLFESNGLFIDYIDLTTIENLDSLVYTGNIGGGQGEIDLTIRTNYDNSIFSENQLIELSYYNKDNLTGVAKYMGFIKNINRIYSKDLGDNIELEILGLGSLLGEYSGTFIQNDTLNNIISLFITQFHGVYNITKPMEFLGSNIFSNGVVDTTNVNINITGTYFEILEEIFLLANKTFYIKKDGTILLGDQSNVKHVFILNDNIIDLRISGTRETEITLAGIDYNIEPGDKIIIENINQNYNMDNYRVEKVEYGLLETKIYLGEIWSLGTRILKG